ncbi:ATP-binding protein [Anaerobaca lacustris]|uniref:AAA family ATPase n=1 Tax=Anaerobaca lacustris TaxID=3044600 RepID=A0AAW6U434_9BACT|nr:AAA family ATPase [Sedimentisphaerales bacterium M17dextr]
MPNEAHAGDAVVGAAVCSNLLALIKETVSSDGKFVPLVCLLEAFVAYALDGEPCCLTLLQYREYCHQEGLDRSASYTENTLRKNASHLSTWLLEPACAYLDYASRVAVSFDGSTSECLRARLKWAPFRSLFTQSIKRRDTSKPIDKACLKQAYVYLSSDQSSKGGRQPQVTTAVEELRRAAGSSQIVPVRDERSVMETGRRQSSSKYSPVGIEHWEYTRLLCVFEPSPGIRDDALVEMLKRRHEIFAMIVKRWSGHVDPCTDGRMHATFGYPIGIEQHSLAALRAGMELQDRFGLLGAKERQGAFRVPFYIGIYTGRMSINTRAVETNTVIVMSKEARKTFEVMEQLNCPSEVFVNELACRRTATHFDFASVQSATELPSAIPIYRVRSHRFGDRMRKLPGRSDIALIGRSAELNTLKRLWPKVMRHESIVVWIRGHIGIGKSRLIEEFLSLLRTANDLHILRCPCWPFHRTVAFHPITEMIRNYLRLDSTAQQDVVEQRVRCLTQRWRIDDERAVGTLTTVLCDESYRLQGRDWASDEVRDKTEPWSSVRKELPDIFYRGLCWLQGDKPVVMAIEDLQWADESTRDLLYDLVHRLSAKDQERRILLLCSTRDPLRDWSYPASGIEVYLDLRPLGSDDAQALAYAAAESVGEIIGSRRLKKIVDESGGIPQAIVEQACGDSGEESIFKKMMVLSQSESASARHAVNGEFIVQIASIAGLIFRRRELQRAVSRALGGGDEVDGWFNKEFDRLLESQVFHPKPPRQAKIYGFWSESFRASVYSSMSDQDKQRQHIAFAEMIEDEFSDIGYNAPEELARHYSKACDLGTKPVNPAHLEKAVYWWHRASHVASDRLAVKEASLALACAQWYARKAYNSDGHRDSELHLLLDLITASEIRYGPADRRVRRQCKRAHELAKNNSERSLVFQAKWRGWFFTYVSGDFRRSLGIATDLLNGLADETETALWLEAHHALWDTLFHIGELNTVQSHHLAGAFLASDLSAEEHRQGFAGHAANTCNLVRSALTYWLRGDFGLSNILIEKGMKVASALEHTQSRVHAHCYTAIHAILCRKPNRIVEHANIALTVAEDRSLRPLMAFAGILRAVGQVQQELPNTRELLSLREHLAERTYLGIRLFETLFLASLAEGYLKTGDCENGMRVIADALKVSEDTGELVFRSELHRIRGELLADSTKNRQEAKAEFQQATEWADHTGARLLKIRALASFNMFLRSYRAGKKERLVAEERLRTALQQLSRGVECQDLIEARKILEDN